MILTKPAAAPAAVKADRAPGAQDRSADFAEVLAGKSEAAAQVDRGGEESKTPRNGVPSDQPTPKGGPGLPGVDLQDAERNELGETGAHDEEPAPPCATAHKQSEVDRAKPDEAGHRVDVEVNPIGRVQVEPAAVVPKPPSTAADAPSEGDDHAAVVPSTVPRPDRAATGEEAAGSSASAGPARAKPPQSARADHTPNQIGRADETPSVTGDDQSVGVRSAAPARPLTIRELNELLVRIDPQWASKGLALPVAVAAASRTARSSDPSRPSERSAIPPTSFDSISTDPQPGMAIRPSTSASDAAAQTAATHTNSSPDGTNSDPAPASPRAHAAEQGSKASDSSAAVGSPTDRGPSAAQVATPIAAPAAGPHAIEKPTGTPPSSARTIFGIEAARPTVKPGAHAAPSTANPNANGPAINAQVQRGLAAAIAQGGGQVTLRLRPEALGQLRVKLDLRADVVKLRFEVGSSAARSLLDDQLPGLGRMLEAQGLHVAHSSVGTDPSLAGPAQNPSHDANGSQAQQFATDVGGQWGGGGAGSGAEGWRQASEHAVSPSESAEADGSPRSGEVHIEHEGGVLDPVTLRLNAIA